MGIEERFLNYLNNSKKNNFQDDESAFITCPKIFYSNLSESELNSMQQLYKAAYEKAREIVKKAHYGFYNGDGI